MRFYLDEDLSYHIAEVARQRGLDVVSSHECGRNGLPDEDQLRLASADGRCLVTRNYADFAAFTRQFCEMSWSHAGVLFVPPSLPNHCFVDIAIALVEYDRGHPQGLPAYVVDYLRPAPAPR